MVVYYYSRLRKMNIISIHLKIVSYMYITFVSYNYVSYTERCLFATALIYFNFNPQTVTDMLRFWFNIPSSCPSLYLI